MRTNSMNRLLLATCGSLAAAMLGGCLFAGLNPKPPTADDMQAHAVDAKAPPPISFPEAEAIVPPLVSAWLPSNGSPPPTALRVYLRDDDWQMDRNEAGRIMDRYVQVTVLMKGGQSGKCWLRNGNVAEEEQGGRWGKPHITMPQQQGFVAAVTCSSVESLRPGLPMNGG